jgi:hypothetical protein
MDGKLRQSNEAKRYLPERIPPAAARASENTLVQAAETVARRCHEAVRPDQAREYTNAATVRERNEGRNKVNNLVRPQEEQALRRWAEQNGLMLDSEGFDRQWRQQGGRGESEHRLYFDQTAQRWFKSNNLSNYGNWMAYFQAIQLHNWLFPVAPLKFEGFVNEGIYLRPLVSQPHIPALRGATQVEVDATMLRLGFEPIRMRDPARQYDYLSNVVGIEVNDLHDENALVTEPGEIVVIDPVPMMEEASKLTRLRAWANPGSGLETT